MFFPFSIAPIHFLACCRTFYFLYFSLFFFIFPFYFLTSPSSLFLSLLFFCCTRKRLRNSLVCWSSSLGSLSPSSLGKQAHKHLHHCLLCMVLCALLMCSLVTHCHCLLCVVITWIVDVFPFIPVVVACCIGKKRMCWFLTSSSSSSPSISSEQARKTLSTFFFTMWFFFGSPYLFLCVVLAMFFPLLLLDMCGSMHTNVFPLFFIIIACYMWLSHK